MNPRRYRKRPVVVEAIQWDGGNLAEIHECFGFPLHPLRPREDGALSIWTLEGNMRANVDDWIVKGVRGELYPVKPSIFEETYERLEPAE